MIPVKLKLRNFMCYRDNVPPLDFTGIHTASIWGANGHGKSALIDAMTWALWGEARAKHDDDLIHSGQTEMEVEFDFAVGQQTYRVIRKHAKPKRRQASGQTILEFQIATGNGFKPITGDSIRQTQQEIIKVLRMDYHTFINSAYLRQGHADEFTISDPAKRKQVLANILGLTLYDELEEEVKELVKQRETEKTQLESALQDIDEELSQKPAYQAELEQAQANLSRREALLKEQESRVKELQQKKEILRSKQGQLAQLKEHLAETTKALAYWDEQVKQLYTQIKEYEELITQRAAIEAGYAQFTEAKKLKESLDQKLRLVTTLRERKHQLEMAIIQSSQALVKEHTLTENKIRELEASAQKLPLRKSELQQVETELLQLTEEETKLRQKRQSSQEGRTYLNYLEGNKTHLEQEIREIEEKLNLLLNQTEAKCPLCETELGPDGLELIKAKYTTDKEHKAEVLRTKQSELAQKEIEVKAQEGEISQIESRLNQARASAQSKAGFLSLEISETEKASQQLNEERGKLAEIEERLAKRDFAITEQEALRRLESELAKIDYDPQQHEEVHHRLTELESYENSQRKLEEADRRLNQEKEALFRAEQAAQERRRSLEADNEKGQGLTLELDSLPLLDAELAQAETEHQRLSTQQRQAQEVVGNIKGKLERCSELEEKKKEKEKSLSAAAREERIYRELAEAFGKRGIQALLIEIALPEIEVEADKLLARMTDNRMHVKFETQRETKKGGLRETLDINIADDLGTRNYEMFSGGEAFRINFAIRIALSKLLARRAGAPLPTLIIDEGFGTQDSSGLEKLKEAITSIQDNFDKILVITHIEEFRDAFPTRIDVIKTAEGSTFEVS